MSLLAKESVQLPPLIVDGEPKVLSEMTLKQMHACLINAMRQCYSSHPVRNVFSIKNEVLPWWPVDRISWSAYFKKSLPEEQRRIMYCHLLTTCYMFYGQLDTLHMFDSKPGDSVKWTLSKENGNYKIIFLSSCRADATIPSHKIFPFIAAETKQIEMSNMTKGKPNFNEIAKMKLDHSLISQRASVEVKNEDLERNLSDVSVRLTPLEISTDEEIALHCRRNSVSIMGVLSPHRSESETESLSDIETSPGASLTCSFCRIERFYTKKDLLSHMVQCQPKSRAQIDKCNYLYQLGLVSVDTKREYEKVLETQTADERTFSFKTSKVDFQTLVSKLPLSCLLSRKLLSQRPSSYVQINNGKKPWSFLDPQTYKVEKSSQFAIDSRQFFPVVCKPTSTRIHYHTLSFTNAERRYRTKFLETGGLNSRSRKLLKDCKNCTVYIERLPDWLLRKYNISFGPTLIKSKSGRVVNIKKIFDNSNLSTNNRVALSVKRIRTVLPKRIKSSYSTKTKTRRINWEQIFDAIILNNKPKVAGNGKLFNQSVIFLKTPALVKSQYKVKTQIVQFKRSFKTTNLTAISNNMATSNNGDQAKRCMNSITIMQNSLDSTFKPRRQPAILRRRLTQINDVAHEETVTASSPPTSENSLKSTTTTNEDDKNKITLYKRGLDGDVRPLCVRLDKAISLPPGIRISDNCAAKFNVAPTPLNDSVSYGHFTKEGAISSYNESSDYAKRARTDFDSILLKCHICGEELLFSKGTWANVESHMNSFHGGMACVYTQSEHNASTYNKERVLMVEAFNIKR